MTNDANFEHYMEMLGVKRLKDHGPVKALAPVEDHVCQSWLAQEAPEVVEDRDEDRALFLQALESLPTQAFEKDQAEPEKPNPFRKLKRRVKGDHEDVLDLHGMTREQAIQALSRFVAAAYTHKRKSVMVITGKGKHSAGGKSVLKPEVERWILKQGRYYLRAYADAPRAFGGRGAFILHLYPPS